LRDRGVSNPDEFQSLNAAVLESELRRFDADPIAGAGALVHRLRQAMKAGQSKRAASATERETEYGRSIVQWLSVNFPELCDPKWGPHPAAVAAVIRLHHVHGKQSLVKGAYGSVVRAAVAEWERKFGDGGMAKAAA